MTTAEQLFTAAMQLSPEEREALAGRLLGSLDEDRDPGYEEAWAAEIERRLKDHDAGDGDWVEWDEALAAMFPERRR
ncbi:MAG: addiction module protein [Chloroflexi bacterium]|nr:addiction module protein [Chloroflexota bacterium]